MKSLTFPIILGLLAIMCHAAPSPVQPKARQVTTLYLTFYGAGENPPSYEIDVTLEQQENFQSFNISESIPSPTQSGLLAPLSLVFHTCLPRESWHHHHHHNHHPDLSVPANPLSVSSIFLGGPGFCGITGIDGSETTVQGGYEADVGPPQVQMSGVCSTF